jgi:hypothetical protein
VKLQESETELRSLREELLILRTQQVEFKKQVFTIHSLRGEVAKQVKKSERAHSTTEKWKMQMEQSLMLVQQLQAELVASKEDQFASLRMLKRRLVLKSIWFRTQLIKLERLQELCMGLDHYLKPELTCPCCLEIFKYPQSLSPCGHSMCADCVNTVRAMERGRREECGGGMTQRTASNTVDACSAHVHVLFSPPHASFRDSLFSIPFHLLSSFS